MVTTATARREALLFDVVVYTVLVAVSVTMVYPFLNVIAVSFSSYSAFLSNPMMIWPRDVTLEAFRFVFNNSLILSSYRNTIVVTIVGTTISVGLTILTAYPLSRRGLKGKAFFMTYIILTMMFSGGIVPSFLLVRSLGILNTLWALILPMCFSAYNVILMKSFFENIPDSLKEAAAIDGASEWFILSRIFVPLSTPIIATVTLFSAVAYWNSFFLAVLYIRDQGLWTLQLVLREIIMAANTAMLDTGGNYAEMSSRTIPADTLKYATLIVAVLPILCVYPFLQKYFVKGIMLGAVKG
ncbi:MAG: carbohydrate ABC transporter permease [Spirochaetaceae bacterium]|nr:MAG: carbohydrate ABC transporter permease [Spirochaetaceae bacterium]